MRPQDVAATVARRKARLAAGDARKVMEEDSRAAAARRARTGCSGLRVAAEATVLAARRAAQLAVGMGGASPRAETMALVTEQAERHRAAALRTRAGDDAGAVTALTGLGRAPDTPLTEGKLAGLLYEDAPAGTVHGDHIFRPPDDSSRRTGQGRPAHAC